MAEEKMVQKVATRRVFDSSAGKLYDVGDIVTLPASMLEKGNKAPKVETDKGGLAEPTEQAIAEAQRSASAPAATRATVAGTPGGPTASPKEEVKAEAKTDAKVNEGGRPRRKAATPADPDNGSETTDTAKGASILG